MTTAAGCGVTFLAAADVRRLTKRVRYGAQRRALTAMGYHYTLAADGEPLVRAEALDGKLQQTRSRGPKWDRIAQ